MASNNKTILIADDDESLRRIIEYNLSNKGYRIFLADDGEDALNIFKSENVDIVIHSAAVSDFTVNNKQDTKIKSIDNLHLELEPTTKIFENIKKIKKDILLIGFKAEHNVSEKTLIDRAYDLLQSANADFVVAAATNGISRMEIDESSGATTATLPLTIVRLYGADDGTGISGDNQFGEFNRLEVKINNHVLGGGTGADGI